MAKANKKTLNQIVEILKQELNPARIFLFGSQANGTARKDSDYDFVVVTKTPAKWTHLMRSRMRSLIRNEVKVSADVFVYSEKEFSNWKDELSSIPETALNTGKELEL
ncbi:MAG: nucleotidyltransferase domain-containing protein [Moraxellaceae bacterium]|nr:nucleotidyltransferase domain-containing protein [Pseudobdellovibrionaceae bacterium]